MSLNTSIVYEWMKQDYNNNNKNKINDLEYSIVMPVYNQEEIIVGNVASILMNTVGKYEIILILDGCEDGTEINIVTFLKTIEQVPSNLCHTIVFRNKVSVFETSSDNIGFKVAKGIYIVEIQADMTMMTYGYNFLLSRPCRVWNDVFAVSGRCCHQWLDQTQGCGKIGAKAEHPLELKFNDMNKFYVCETCNRGPLLFINSRLTTLNYLDEKNFVLENDEHDVMARAFHENQWICGYVPIEVYSPLKLGSTRKPRNKTNSDILQQRISQSNGGFLTTFLNTLKTIPNYKPNPVSIRSIPFFHPNLLLLPQNQPTNNNISKTTLLSSPKTDDVSISLYEIGLKHGTDKSNFKILLEYYENKLVQKKRNTEKIRVLEIGVFFGSSLKMWNEYFGPNCEIYGMDHFTGKQGSGFVFEGARKFWDQVHQDQKTFSNIKLIECDQSQKNQLLDFTSQMKQQGIKFDFILDDGSHLMKDQQQSLGILWSLLKPDGLYFMEDWPSSFDTKNYDVDSTSSNTTFKMMNDFNDTKIITSQYIETTELKYINQTIQHPIDIFKITNNNNNNDIICGTATFTKKK